MGGARSVSQSSSAVILEMREVDRDFSRKKEIGHRNDSKVLRALTRVSLKLNSGEFVFLTGPSGAGKTTLLRLALGLDQPTSGEILTLGQPMHSLSESKRREMRRQIGVVFQDHRLLNSLDVYENIELPLRFQGLARKERDRRVLEILETIQMRDHIHASVKSLSAGEKQRVAIARALVICPSLILADEPTGNLDPVSARSLIRMLRELRGHGTTVLIATHDMSLVRDFGGRVLELIGGSMPTGDVQNQGRAYKVPQFWTASNL